MVAQLQILPDERTKHAALSLGFTSSQHFLFSVLRPENFPSFAKLISHFRLTNNTNGFPDETKSPTEAHVLRSTSRRPQSDDVLDAEEDDEANFHPEKCLVCKFRVHLDR